MFTLYTIVKKMTKTSKNGISMRTVNRCISDLDVTKTWIKTETEGKHWADGQPIVTKIRCKVCIEFAARLKNVRNFSTAFIDGISGALKRDNVNKHSMPVMHGAPSCYRMRERPTFSVDTCLKTTPIVTASDLTYVLVLLINFSWLLINLKSWSKTATHFWKSIFITARKLCYRKDDRAMRSIDYSTLILFTLSRYLNVTDRQTDKQTIYTVASPRSP